MAKFLDDTGLGTFWAKIKSTFQTLGNLVTAWGSTPSDTKYPSEKLVKDSLDAKAADSAVLHKAGLETASGQKWFEGGFCVFNSSHIGYGHFTLAGAGGGPAYNNWTEEQKDGAHFREWSLSFNSGVNFWGKIRITISTSYSSFNASGSMQKTINCAFNTMTVFNNTGYYNDLGINSEKEFRISDLIWNNTTECWEIKIHSIKPTSNNGVPVLLIEFWTYSTSNRDAALGIHWVSTSPSIVTDTTYYTKRSGNASTSPGTGGVQFNWADTPVFQSPYGYEIFDRSHTIPVDNGGTGKTTAKAAEYNLTTGKSEISDTTSGDDRVVFELASPSESNGVTRGFRKLSTIWTWIKGLLSSESGVNISGSSASCTGNAATATALSAGADRTKLDGIAAGAEVNVQSDWNQATTTADDYIKNKPTIPSGTQLVYDCGTGGTSTTDFDNALAAFNAGRWVIIHTNSSIYYCVGTYDNGLRFRQLTNETDTMKVSTVTWTRGYPLVLTQLEASLSGHTHSQYLTASDITGKMNTSGDNATAPSGSGGDGATATLLNNLTGPNNLDDITSDNVCIPTTNSDGTDQTKWYKRPLSKLWPWIISHTKTRILKASDDVYWGVGADSTHAIDLDYDGSASSPTMGLWVRWGSGSSNAKYMAECDASGNCKFNGNASSATTISGSQVMLPSHSSDGYIGVEQSGKAKAYLEAYDSKGGVWVNNGGKTNWLAYRDSDGSVHFGADSPSGYRGVAGDESVKNLFNGAELCGNSYMNSGTSHYRFYFGKMTPGTDNGAKHFCGLLEVNTIATTSGAVRGTGFVAIVKIDARNYNEFNVNMSIINNNGWNLTGLRPTLIVTESGDDRQFSIGFTNASGTLQAFQYTRFNVTGIGYSNGFTYFRLFSATSTKSSSDYFWPAKLGDAENADTVDGYHFAMGTYGGVANTFYFG